MKVATVLGALLLTVQLSHAYEYGARTLNGEQTDIEPDHLVVPNLAQSNAATNAAYSPQTFAADFVNSKQHPLFFTGFNRAAVRASAAAERDFDTQQTGTRAGLQQHTAQTIEQVAFNGYDYRPGRAIANKLRLDPIIIQTLIG